MKTTKIYFIFLLICTSEFAFAQYFPSSPKKNNDIETLEKLNSMMERDNNNELKAKQAVASYRSEVRAEMREIFRFLTDEQAKILINRESGLWEISTQNLKYSRNYQSFYQDNYQLLETYKESMLDYISSLTR